MLLLVFSTALSATSGSRSIVFIFGTSTGLTYVSLPSFVVKDTFSIGADLHLHLSTSSSRQLGGPFFVDRSATASTVPLLVPQVLRASLTILCYKLFTGGDDASDPI